MVTKTGSRLIFRVLSSSIYSFFFKQQPVTEGYQYSQLSPSRSPSGPTYTQLSAGNSRQTSYHTTPTAQSNAGLFL